MSFSLISRKQDIERLKNETLDLLTIGGGITGAGVAIQASAMGMNNALIEMQDFAEGTSSRSTKLVHGGIRYLKNFDDIVSSLGFPHQVFCTMSPLSKQLRTAIGTNEGFGREVKSLNGTSNGQQTIDSMHRSTSATADTWN